MSRLNESVIEDHAIKLFERLGYRYVYAPDIAPDGENPERSHYGEVILKDRLRSAVQRINPSVPRHALQAAVKDVERIHSPELLANNDLSSAAHRRREGQLSKGWPRSRRSGLADRFCPS
ncbi:MAG: type I restriction endonuclease [Methylococcales bacterium]